jgi:serine protease Do
MAAAVPGFGNVADDLRRVTVQVLAEQDHSHGSGVITGPSTIVTNAHVATSDAVRVLLATGELVKATLKKRDRARDLAMLTLIDARAMQPAAVLRETASLRPGEIAIAVGHPLGFLGAVSTGLIRGVGPIAGLGQRPWVQAAVRLAPGNSGGPLADIHGRIIGINTMVVNSLGLAIPSEAVQRFLSAAPPFRLGITVRPARLSDGTQGVLVLEIEPDSPAWRASLLPGDLIIGVEAAEATNVEALDAALALAGAEKRSSVVVRFRRGGSPRERQATAAQYVYAERAA